MKQDPRPLSPHLQVYKPQLTSMLSILHRGTGIVLGFGALVLSLYLVAVATGPASFQYFHAFFHSWIGELSLLVGSGCLYYHLCNGIRHLFWDCGRGFALPTVYASGVAVVVGTVVLTGVTWLCALGGAGG